MAGGERLALPDADVVDGVDAGAEIDPDAGHVRQVRRATQAAERDECVEVPGLIQPQLMPVQRVLPYSTETRSLRSMDLK